MAVEKQVRETLCPAAVHVLSASPPDTRDRCGRRDPCRPRRQAPVTPGTPCAARTVASHELRNRRRPRRHSRGLPRPRRLAHHDELPYGPADERAHIVGHVEAAAPRRRREAAASVIDTLRLHGRALVGDASVTSAQPSTAHRSCPSLGQHVGLSPCLPASDLRQMGREASGGHMGIPRRAFGCEQGR